MNKRHYPSKSPPHQRPKNPPREPKSSQLLFYGQHAVIAALGNPNRSIKKLVVAQSRYQLLQPTLDRLCNERSITKLILDERDFIDFLKGECKHELPNSSLHQHIVAQVSPLPQRDLCAFVEQKKPPKQAPFIALDKVTDPHNVGAILRSAAAFGAAGLILPLHDSPSESATIAKVACGALDLIPVFYVTNLGKSLKELKDYGYWTVGLDGEADAVLSKASIYDRPLVIVMGSEGKGLRPSTAKECDMLTKIPILPQMESLNVSNAAAIVLYELARHHSDAAKEAKE